MKLFHPAPLAVIALCLGLLCSPCAAAQVAAAPAEDEQLNEEEFADEGEWSNGEDWADEEEWTEEEWADEGEWADDSADQADTLAPMSNASADGEATPATGWIAPVAPVASPETAGPTTPSSAPSPTQAAQVQPTGPAPTPQ